MKILLAADGSRYSKKMLAYLAAHDEVFGTQHAYVVLSVSAPIPIAMHTAESRAAVQQFHADENAKVLAPIAKFLSRQGLDAKTVAKVGLPGPVIARFAETGKFDLVVMGSHGHGALANLVLGSVATQVLARCRVPVLLVR
jgi:nucleotide-binding universal stress UspA family protein